MEKTQNNDLVEFLGKQFDNIKAKLTNLGTRQDKMLKRLTAVETGQNKVWREVLGLREEKIVGTYRSHHMESWITKAAKKIDLPYNP